MKFTVRDSSGKTTTMPKGKYFIHAQQGKLFFDDNNEFGNEAFVATAAGKSSPQINKRSYKGDFQLQAEQGNKLLVVNRLPLEDYLASVLPAKTMSVWLMRLSRHRRLLPAAMLCIKCSTATRLMLCLQPTGSCLTEVPASALKSML